MVPLLIHEECDLVLAGFLDVVLANRIPLEILLVVFADCLRCIKQRYLRMLQHLLTHFLRLSVPLCGSESINIVGSILVHVGVQLIYSHFGTLDHICSGASGSVLPHSSSRQN